MPRISSRSRLLIRLPLVSGGMVGQTSCSRNSINRSLVPSLAANLDLRSSKALRIASVFDSRAILETSAAKRSTSGFLTFSAIKQLHHSYTFTPLLRPIYEHALTPTPCEEIMRQCGQHPRVIFVRPEKHFGRAVPKLCEGARRFKHVGRVRKFRAVPEIPAGLVQNAHTGLEIKIQS